MKIIPECPSCAASIERRFKKFPQVSDIDISIRKGLAVVTIKDGQTLADNDIEEGVKDAGYRVSHAK